MAYNKLNKYKLYKKVLEIVTQHYISGITTYAGIYREYVYSVYPISYKTFMNIVNFPNLEQSITDETKKRNEGKNQLEMFTE